MAYGQKYQFKFENIHGITYEVDLLEDGYSGNVTKRPLGSAPVIRMQTSGPFRSTCCELTLECQTDGEYVDLYTSDPRKYKVEVYHGSILVWHGFVATELYSEPDIAPPYDVRITATDGLGVLKEYDFEPVGPRTVRQHLKAFLAQTGLEDGVYSIFAVHESGDTVPHFFDNVLIDLDYHEGDSIYEVLEDLLVTLRCTITQWDGNWMLIRETDASVNGSGAVPGYFIHVLDSAPTYSLNISNGISASVGKMGVADMWPVGHLTRRVVPAKKSVKVTSDWHLKNGSPALTSWTGHDDAHTDIHSANPNNVFWALGTGYAYTPGRIAASMNTYNFQRDIKVTLKVSGSFFSHIRPSAYVKVLAAWVSNGVTKYYSPEEAWDASASSVDNDEIPVTGTNVYGDPSVCQIVEVTIPCAKDSNPGYFAINVVGLNVEVYDVDVQLVAGGGYEDTILIDNGARGTAEDIKISGGREVSLNLLPVDFVAGVFFRDDGASADEILTSFSDNDNTSKDYMSLTALNYAKSVAAPRIEITGIIDFPVGRFLQPLLIKSHNVWALMDSYDWNLKEAEINFKAVTLPTATLTVASETIKTK